MSEIKSIDELKGILTKDATNIRHISATRQPDTILDFSTSSSITSKRRQSKVRWDLLNIVRVEHEEPFLIRF